MRNIRLKLILFFLVSSLGVGIYIWVNNFKKIDILRTKNDSVANSQIHQVKNSTDIEFIRENAINNINWNKENRHRKSNVAVTQSKLILLQLILLLLSLILGIIHFIKC
ncbi:hypothetical protein [Tenacibaculum halocynthiae]|uniref:hypothetical protein n=1 Tax=Tenacibaculum halocynthiae TaxID=1254437 RepID=UPI003D660139